MIAALSSFLLIFLKEVIDRKRDLKLEKENIFIEFADAAYRLTKTKSESEIHSSEQEFYLAMTNATVDAQTRELYMFMYKDYAEKFAMAFKEYLNALSDFNKLIARYVLQTKDRNIASQIQEELNRLSESPKYDYSTKDINKINELRTQNLELIDKIDRNFYEFINSTRFRVYEGLGFTHSKQN